MRSVTSSQDDGEQLGVREVADTFLFSQTTSELERVGGERTEGLFSGHTKSLSTPRANPEALFFWEFAYLSGDAPPSTPLSDCSSDAQQLT